MIERQKIDTEFNLDVVTGQIEGLNNLIEENLTKIETLEDAKGSSELLNGLIDREIGNLLGENYSTVEEIKRLELLTK